MVDPSDAYKDVDFIITVKDAPASVKQKLLELPKSRFIQLADFFFYNSPSGKKVQIDITHEHQVYSDNVTLSTVPDLADI